MRKTAQRAKHNLQNQITPGPTPGLKIRCNHPDIFAVLVGAGAGVLGSFGVSEARGVSVIEATVCLVVKQLTMFV
jgi:hypothetical protein